MAAAGPWTLTGSGRTYLAQGVFAIGTDSFKMGLATSSSNLSSSTTTYAGVTGELTTANGYTSGGQAVTLAAAGSAGTCTVTQSAGIVWTASGAGITARFSFIYEVGGNVLAYALLDSTPADVTATSGNTLTVGGTSATVLTVS
jgi:hypothetical protein